MESLDQTAPNYVLVVEVHSHSDRKHIIRQLLQQVEALKQRSVQNRFGFNHPYLVLSVFCDENIKVMQGVLEELKQMPEWEYFKNYFFFSRLEDLKADFCNGLGYFGRIEKPFPKRFDKIKFFNKIKYIKIFCYRQVSISRFILPPYGSRLHGLTGKAQTYSTPILLW